MVNILKIHDKKVDSEFMDLYQNGMRAGHYIGFEGARNHYNLRLGNTTILYGHPTSGKSQFMYQLLISMVVNYEMRPIIYSPETGTAAEIYCELIHCLTGKSMNKAHKNYISEKELYNAKAFVQEYFTVIEGNDEAGISFEQWFEIVKEAKKLYNCNLAVIDNWNDLDHNLKEKGNGLISEYLKYALPKWNRFAKYHNIHNIMVCHARNPTVEKGEQFPRAPRPDEIEGGSVWYAKAQSLICIHRNYIEHNGNFIQSNIVDIDIRKAKPKIVGTKGRFALGFDLIKNAYYEEFEGYQRYISTPFNNIDNNKSKVDSFYQNNIPF
jgi:hypothetical protein